MQQTRKITRSGDADLDEYSELFKESIVKYQKAAARRGNLELWSCYYKSDNKDKVYEQKLKAVVTLSARLVHLRDNFNFNCITLFRFLCLTTPMKSAKRDKRPYQLFFSSLVSASRRFREQAQRGDIYALLDLEGTSLKNIEAYNSTTLSLLKDEDLNEVTLQEMGNHFLNFGKGLSTLSLKVSILRFHMMQRRLDLETLVNRFSTCVESELLEFEKQLNTTRFRVFELSQDEENHDARASMVT